MKPTGRQNSYFRYTQNPKDETINCQIFHSPYIRFNFSKIVDHDNHGYMAGYPDKGKYRRKYNNLFFQLLRAGIQVCNQYSIHYSTCI